MDKIYWEENIEKFVNDFLQNGVFDASLKGKYLNSSHEDGTLEVEFETLQWQLNGRGIIHGAVLSGMLDTALAAMCNFLASKNGHGAVTSDMTLSYIRPANMGEQLVAKVFIVKEGKMFIRVRGELMNKETGKLLTTASGTWAVI